MIKAIIERVRQGHRTIRFPGQTPTLPERFRGRPVIDSSKCADGCRECEECCPTGAVTVNGGGASIDLGRCLFCGECMRACQSGAITFTRDFRLAAREKGGLIVKGDEQEYGLEALSAELLKLFGRSLKLRQVSAGGCNGCEADVNVLGTVVFDIGRFGVDMVASPRHADGLLVTGPVPENMRIALMKTYDAVPSPKIVIASGACAISGGPYIGRPEAHDGAGKFIPVDLYIPGCPPHPLTILDAVVRLLGRS